MSMVQDIIDQQDREIERLRSRLAESEAENARLVAANKARDEFLRGHRYKHSEVDGYIDLCESQMATLKARLAEAEALRKDAERWRHEWQRECADTDLLLQGMGLCPSEYRSEGGSLLLGRISHKLKQRGGLS